MMGGVNDHFMAACLQSKSSIYHKLLSASKALSNGVRDRKFSRLCGPSPK